MGRMRGLEWNRGFQTGEQGKGGLGVRGSLGLGWGWYLGLGPMWGGRPCSGAGMMCLEGRRRLWVCRGARVCGDLEDSVVP